MAPPSPTGATYDFDVRQATNDYTTGVMNQQDLDRNFGLATSHLFKWMQAARMDLQWVQPGYRAFSELEPKLTRRLLVGSQMIRLASPGILVNASDSRVVTRVEIGDIGRTTIEFRYKIFFDSQQVGVGSVTMIAMAGSPGSFKPTPIPDDVKPLGGKEPSPDAKYMKDALANMPKQAPSDAYATSVIVRYSDEDINKHANHSAQARFFEDAKEIIAADAGADPALRAVASQPLEAVLISYAAEARATEELRVKVTRSAHDTLSVWVERVQPNPGLVARGQMVCSGGAVESREAVRLTSNL